MTGKVSIPDLIRQRDQSTLTRGETALLSLLGMAGADLEDFRDADSHERLIRELENVSAGISDEVFEYWSQNTELAVKLQVLQPEAGAPAPLNEGPILQIRVETGVTAHQFPLTNVPAGSSGSSPSWPISPNWRRPPTRTWSCCSTSRDCHCTLAPSKTCVSSRESCG
ncbi:MAG TPA: hypothetical protein VFQ77_07810 [Pseudonocardiaceae bacterium]|jgi:hypothetical protein|nr:hypothetical protein [Pseudonocardiaceae bacterium]